MDRSTTPPPRAASSQPPSQQQQTHLREIQDTQMAVAQRLHKIQQTLFHFEEQYLETTQMRGNCLKGWEGFLDYKARNDNGGKRKFKASDRVYSFSSLSAPIPKAELEKDVDAGAARRWAEFCENALEEREAKRVKTKKE